MSPPSVANSQRHLLQLTVPDSMNTAVPLPVRDAISDFKRTLALATDAIVQKLPPDASPASIKDRLAEAMPSPAVGKISDDQWVKIGNSDKNQPLAGLYGGELTLSVKKPSPSHLLVQETFTIACGTDNVLLVYSNATGAWKRILLWQSKPYTSISEAFGGTYETLLLRPKRNGHPLLLVLHGTPWCTSVMSGFSMDALELKDSTSSVPLWHGEHGYRIDSDPPLTLRRTDDGFEVRASVSTIGERVNRKGGTYAVVARKGVMRYAVRSDGIHRVEPIALNAHDSVEEWLDMPRTEAAEFADQPAASLTRTMFDDFTYENKPRDAVRPFPRVGAVRACKDTTSHFQAEVTSELFDPDAKGSRPGPAYFVQLRQVPNGYRIHAVTRTQDPSCNGPDLMLSPLNSLSNRDEVDYSRSTSGTPEHPKDLNWHKGDWPIVMRDYGTRLALGADLKTW